MSWSSELARKIVEMIVRHHGDRFFTDEIKQVERLLDTWGWHNPCENPDKDGWYVIERKSMGHTEPTTEAVARWWNGRWEENQPEGRIIVNPIRWRKIRTGGTCETKTDWRSAKEKPNIGDLIYWENPTRGLNQNMIWSTTDYWGCDDTRWRLIEAANPKEKTITLSINPAGTVSQKRGKILLYDPSGDCCLMEIAANRTPRWWYTTPCPWAYSDGSKNEV